jgi:hypothetical protein
MKGNTHIQGFIGKPEIRKPCGRTKHRWDDNTETDIKK